MSNAGERVAALLRPVPDFPKPGILFWDIAPVLRDTHLLHAIEEEVDGFWREYKIDVVAGFDARGFIFGSLLAAKFGVPFEQIRKKGKLPGKTVSVEYNLEYGSAEVEMIDDGFIADKHVLLVDDLLATGGTALAGAQLVEKLGGTVAGFVCITDIPHLGGRARLSKYPAQSLVSIIGDKPEWDVEYCADMLVSTLDNEYILVNRLSEPPGYAMPGGRIEDESAEAAARREMREEVGCELSDLWVIDTLAERGRDPRGHKISIVFGATTNTPKSEFRGEAGKTEVEARSKNKLPPLANFAFDHGRFVYDYFKH